MALKDYSLSFNKNVNIAISSNGQYSNLNLNQSYKCPEDHESKLRSNGYAKNEFKSISTTSDFNNGNFALHISAYENSLEAQNSNNYSNNNGKNTLKNSKKGKKSFFTTQAAAALKNVYEFPRQQKENSNSKPEIAQFKASQKLLNPNDTNSSPKNPVTTAKENIDESEGENISSTESSSPQPSSQSSSPPISFSRSSTSSSSSYSPIPSTAEIYGDGRTVDATIHEIPPDAVELKDGCIFDTKRHQYLIESKLGSGSFAIVFRAKDENGKSVAIKTVGDIDDIKKECRIMKLAESIASPHFCKLVEAGWNDKYRKYYAIMSLVGEDIDKVISDMGTSTAKEATSASEEAATTTSTTTGTTNSNQTTPSNDKESNTVSLLIICKQSFQALHDLHQIGYTHCDLKNDNLAIGEKGTPDRNTVFLLDFNLALPLKEKSSTPASTIFTRGNHHFASRAALQRFRVSRKDDIESWLFLCLEMFGIEFKWKDVWDNDKNLKLKEEFFENEAATQTELQKCPPCFWTIYQCIRRLKWGDEIPYEYIMDCLNYAFGERTSNGQISVSWNKDRPYQSPPLAQQLQLQNPFRYTFYMKSNKDDHFVLYYHGKELCYFSFKKKEHGQENIATFRCFDENGPCDLVVRVSDYVKENIHDGDQAYIFSVKKQHTCSCCRKPKKNQAKENEIISSNVQEEEEEEEDYEFWMI